jgi:hypothetical protein
MRVTVNGKRNGNHASYLSSVGDINCGVNNGGTIEVSGSMLTTTWGSENSLAGTTIDVISPRGPLSNAQVRVNNPPAYAVDWSITVDVFKRTS